MGAILCYTIDNIHYHSYTPAGAWYAAGSGLRSLNSSYGKRFYIGNDRRHTHTLSRTIPPKSESDSSPPVYLWDSNRCTMGAWTPTKR